MYHIRQRSLSKQATRRSHWKQQKLTLLLPDKHIWAHLSGLLGGWYDFLVMAIISQPTSASRLGSTQSGVQAQGGAGALFLDMSRPSEMTCLLLYCSHRNMDKSGKSMESALWKSNCARKQGSAWRMMRTGQKNTERVEGIFPLAKAGHEFLFFVSKITFPTVWSFLLLFLRH